EESFNSGKQSRVVAFILAEVPGRIIAGHQDTESVLAALAGKLYREILIDNRACVHGLQWCVEDVDALEEEGPLLFEEDRKPRVRRDDGLVGLDLREVRIHGEIQRDRRRKAVLCSHPEIEF